MKEEIKLDNVSTMHAKAGMFTFMQKSYDETLDLLTAVTDYFQRYGKRDREGLTTKERIIYTVAISTITVQLTSVLSWLVAQKAVEKGEITAEQAREKKYRLQHVDMYTREEEDKIFEILSNPIPQMLRRSSGLYERIQRLEKSMLAMTDERTLH